MPCWGLLLGLSPSMHSNIHESQRVGPMWFQGIALDEELGLVYALTGNNTLEQNEKLLYVYDLQGNVLEQKSISMDWSIAAQMGEKYEPEGLSLVKDPVTGMRYPLFHHDVWRVRPESETLVCDWTRHPRPRRGSQRAGDGVATALQRPKVALCPLTASMGMANWVVL